MLTYFTIRLEADILKFDPEGNRYFYNYRYVLEPYQIHYTMVPGQQQGNIDVSVIKGEIKRSYDYIYTGKNEDIIKFNLNFDNLYFDAVPAMMGNKPSDVPKAAASGANNNVEIKQSALTTEKAEVAKGINSVPNPERGVDPSLNDFQVTKAGQTQSDPYYAMAVALHEAVLNRTSLIKGTLEILGDPYFLTNGAMGNRDMILETIYETADGQAPTTQGDTYININFRNPIDISNRTGKMFFDPHLVSYSGVYRITNLKNTFRDGVYTQQIDILRIPGQIVNAGVEKLPDTDTTRIAPGQQLSKDTAPATVLKTGIRPSDFDLANLLDRGLPSPGLPGNLSNFTGAISGAVGGILNQVAGAAGISGNLTSQLGTSPIGGTNPLTSGVRLSASGLGSLVDSTNISAANIGSVGNSLGGITGISNPSTGLAGNVSSQLGGLPSSAISAVNNLFSSGGGSLANGVASATASLPSSTPSLSQATALIGPNASSLAGGITGNLPVLQNSSISDPNAIGAKLGIDPSKLSGLDPKLQSQITSQLTDIAKKVPANTNLGGLSEQGVSFANITGAKLPNLPALQPPTIAPIALPDPAYAAIAAKNGNVNSLLNGATNLADLTDINNVTNTLGGVNAGLSGGFGSSQSILGQIGVTQGQVGNVLGNNLNVANPIGSLNQNSILGFSPSNLGLGSIESNTINVAGLTQSFGSPNNISSTVAAQFGSRQTTSPLTKLINDNNIRGII
jgi:hypothetical protein